MISTTTEATALSDIGNDWCIVAFLWLPRELQTTVLRTTAFWTWSLAGRDRDAFALLKDAGKIITTIGRTSSGELRLYAKLAAHSPRRITSTHAEVRA